MSAIRIKDQIFAVSDPYKAGHQMTAGEAQALNALRAKNITHVVLHRIVFTEMDARDIVAAVDRDYKFQGRGLISSVDMEIRRVAMEVIERRYRGNDIDPLEMEEMIQEEMEKKDTREEGTRRAQIGKNVAQQLMEQLDG